MTLTVNAYAQVLDGPRLWCRLWVLHDSRRRLGQLVHHRFMLKLRRYSYGKPNFHEVGDKRRDVAADTPFLSDCAHRTCTSLKWEAGASLKTTTENWIKDLASWNFCFRPGAFFSVGFDVILSFLLLFVPVRLLVVFWRSFG